MNDPMPRLYVYAMSVATIIMEADRTPEKLLEAKLKSLEKVYSLVEWYARDGIDERLVDTIMEKKAELILRAKSIQDVWEIADPPKPEFDGNTWIISKNSVPEEELIWWLKTSMRAPLIHTAVQRCMKLFEDFYGKSIDDIAKEKGTDEQI